MYGSTTTIAKIECSKSPPQTAKGMIVELANRCTPAQEVGGIVSIL